MHVGNVHHNFLEVKFETWALLAQVVANNLLFLFSTFMLNVAQNLSVNLLLQYGLLYIIGKLLMSIFQCHWNHLNWIFLAQVMLPQRR